MRIYNPSTGETVEVDDNLETKDGAKFELCSLESFLPDPKEDLNLYDLQRQMAELKAKFGPKEDLYQATVVSYTFYNQIRKVATDTPMSLNRFYGIEILPLAGIPEDEGLMFKDKEDAYRFTHLAENIGYEEAKKQMRLLINLKNLK